jgi:hypothetical protein
LITYPGMGHDLPRELWESIIGEFTALASRKHAVAATVRSRE